jgi:hypothetical protein
LLALVACGGDDKKTVDAAPPADVAVDTTTVALNCTTYCNQIQTNCTGTNGQYTDMAHCLGSCAAFTVGTSTVSDSLGDTLGCRIYHSGAPAVADPVLHCPHAGPPGEKINMAAAPTYCSGGDLCATFCAEQIKTCGSTDAPISLGGTAITPQYKNQAACVDVCKNGDNTVTPAILPFDKSQPYGPTAAGPTLACRFNHWTNAASNAAVTPPTAMSIMGTQTHCGHTAPKPTGPCS